MFIDASYSWEFSTKTHDTFQFVSWKNYTLSEAKLFNLLPRLQNVFSVKAKDPVVLFWVVAEDSEWDAQNYDGHILDR